MKLEGSLTSAHDPKIPKIHFSDESLSFHLRLDLRSDPFHSDYLTKMLQPIHFSSSPFMQSAKGNPEPWAQTPTLTVR